MTRRSKVWLGVAVLFSVVNALGGIYAAAMGEPIHALTHAALLVVGVYYVRRIWRREGPVIAALPTGDLTGRLTRLEESVDAVAVEVERIGEGQRFMTSFLTENSIPRERAEGVAQPVVDPSRPDRARG